MKTILYSIRREFQLIFRNGISIFMVAAPAILALVFILVFGAVNESTLTVAVDDTLPNEAIEQLSAIAVVETFDDYEAMSARVRGYDTAVGVTIQNEEVIAVFEGNEGEAVIDSATKLIGLALNAPESGLTYQAVSVEAKGGMAYQISMISVLLMSLFIGGATVGMSVVEERESNAIRAVEVSPLRLARYAVTKVAPALVLGLAGTAAAVLIIGKEHLLGGALLLAAASTLVSGMMVFAIGAFASNQIAAIGVLKLMVPLAMILPVSAMFVSEKWQFFYYILPMYWQYRGLSDALTGGSALFGALMTALTSIPWFVAALLFFAKKTKFRTGR